MINQMPSIGQFKNAIYCVKHKAQFIGLDKNDLPVMNRLADLPTLNFKGTVKLHGTNSSIVFGEETQFRSKNRILSVGNDNSGFMNYMKDVVGQNLYKLRDNIIDVIDKEELFYCTEDHDVIVYGEWCGETIQKKVAITGLPKMFVIFGIKIIDGEDSYWISSDIWKDIEFPEYNIYNINKFPTFSIDIDFENPAMVQNDLAEITQQVEKECPVGKHFGVFGCGEGVVWSCTHPDFSSSDFMFKVKGEKHSVSKVKTLAEVDVEKLKTIDEFMDRVVTENRLQQGIEYLDEMGLEVSQKSTGQFLSWMFRDIMKEEKDVLEASGLDRKDIGKPLGTLARKWYFKRINEV